MAEPGERGLLPGGHVASRSRRRPAELPLLSWAVLPCVTDVSSAASDALRGPSCF